MNLGDLKSRIADSFNDQGMVFFTESDIERAVTEGAEVMAEQARAIHRTAYVPIRDGAQFYFTASIAPDVMYPIRIWNHERSLRLTPTTMLELDAFSRTWMTTTGSPEMWFPVSWDFFGVYPKPAAGGGVLRIDYLAWPRELMDDDDKPEFPDSDHDSLIFYGLHEAQLKEWDAKGAVETFSLFTELTGGLKDHVGAGRVKSREWQRSNADFPTTIHERR